MQFTDLTPAQQTLCQSFMDTFRPVLGALARVENQMTALNNFFGTGVSDAITSMDAGALITTTTSAAGAQTLAREDVLNYMTAVQAILATYFTQQAQENLIKIAGISASMS